MTDYARINRLHPAAVLRYTFLVGKHRRQKIVIDAPSAPFAFARIEQTAARYGLKGDAASDPQLVSVDTLPAGTPFTGRNIIR